MVVQELVALLGLEIDEATFARGEKALGSIRTGLLAAGAAATAAAAAIFHTVHSMTEAADAAGKMAQRTGVDSAALQELSYAAKLADVSTESLEQSMRFLAKSGVKDVKGRLLELADQLQKLPDDGSRAAFAIQHLGKTGTALIPMLRGGREELEAMAAEANALGAVFDQETIDASERFNDTLTRISVAAGGLRNQIAKKFLPVFQKGADAVLSFIKRVGQSLPSMEQLEKWAKFAAVAIGSVLVAALITAGGAFAALSAAAVTAAIRTVLAWATAAAPFLLIAAAVAAAVFVLEDLYRFFSGRGKTVTGDFVDYVKREFGDLQTFLQAFLDWLGTAFTQKIIDIGEKLFGKVEVKTVSQVKADTGPVTSFLLDKLAPFFSSAPEANPNFLGYQTPSGFVPKGSPAPAGGNSFTSNITVNATPGMSVEDLAGKVAEANESWWDGKMRSAASGVE